MYTEDTVYIFQIIDLVPQNLKCHKFRSPHLVCPFGSVLPILPCLRLNVKIKGTLQIIPLLSSRSARSLGDDTTSNSIY